MAVALKTALTDRDVANGGVAGAFAGLRFQYFHHPWRSGSKLLLRFYHSHQPWRSKKEGYQW
jgi:hypothetical protein